MKTEQDYTPFGKEWEAEVMKLPKAVLINMLRTANQKRIEAEEFKTKIPDDFDCRNYAIELSKIRFEETDRENIITFESDFCEGAKYIRDFIFIEEL